MVATLQRLVAALAIAIVASAMAHAATPAEPEGMRQLVPIARVMAARGTGIGRAVRIRGVVTWRRGNGMIVQDDSAGIWLEVADAKRAGYWQAAGDPPANIHEGIEVEVEGWSNQGGFAPNILPERIRAIGKRPLPPPRPFDAVRFFQGVDDCLRVTARGVVQGIRDDGDRWLLLTAEQGKRFTVAIGKPLLQAPPENFLDSVISCVGVATAQFNTRGQFLSPRLNVTTATDLTIEQPPPTAAFESPRLDLKDIGGYQRMPLTGHRICTRGVVTHAEPGRFLYLQQECLGLLVETASQERYQPGDVVDAAGFVATSGFVASLAEAVVRKVGHEPAPAAIPIQPATIVQINALAARRYTIARPGDYYGCLITFPARVIDAQRASRGGKVLLLAGGSGVALMANDAVFPAVESLEPGSEVMVTGIAVPESELADKALRQGQAADDMRVQILLRAAADITVVKKPSWWKPHRLLAALATVGALAAIAAGWIILLRRQVGRQLSLIESQLQAKAATEERQRIAHEFHDTLEQDLAGIALRMDAAAGRAQDDRSRAEFEQQRVLLARLRAETRDFLWDLQDHQRIDGSLPESLATQAAYQRGLTSVPILLQTADTLPGRIPPLLQYHLLRIAREAVANAIRHADPSRVEVRLAGDSNELILEVIDDGVGFDVEAGESLSGHFGLRGMRERARRMSAHAVIESSCGGGTRVAVHVPRPLQHRSLPDAQD